MYFHKIQRIICIFCNLKFPGKPIFMYFHAALLLKAVILASGADA